MSDTILPSHSTATEVAIEKVIADRFAGIEMIFARMWSVEECPEELLAYLAYTLSVDTWRSDWPESVKRRVISESVRVHQTKGTIGSIRRALEAAGFGDAAIIEFIGANTYDGEIARNGQTNRERAASWAEYDVTLTRPISIARAAVVRGILADVEPARCTLRNLDYRQATLLYDNTAPRDGTFTRGIV